jgi:hypothetical protein
VWSVFSVVNSAVDHGTLAGSIPFSSAEIDEEGREIRQFSAQTTTVVKRIEALTQRSAPSPGLRPPSPPRGEGERLGGLLFSPLPAGERARVREVLAVVWSENSRKSSNFGSPDPAIVSQGSGAFLLPLWGPLRPPCPRWWAP